MGDLTKKVDKSRKQLEALKGDSDPFSIQCYNKVEKEYLLVLSQHDDFWRQRAKQHWLRECIKTQSIFTPLHLCGRGRTIDVTKLKSDQGVWRTGDNSLGELLCAYFTNLFNSQ
ncbi:hypothetical protein Syun_011906 [Stephania yunnanensis]|uniref:Uncharacterized protein n=1 Tax=Stephania yunnanensis TaxID=152371 RepID=A0AAP0JYE9_9MAGN